MRSRLRPVFLLLATVPTVAGAAFDMQAHRGARGLEPENTLPAFARALEIGVDTLELDVGMTRDGVLVVVHDRTLDPDLVRDPTGRYVETPAPTVHSLDAATLARYDVGTLRPGSARALAWPTQRARPHTRMPTLTDVFALVRRAGNTRVRFNIETKVSPLAPQETAPPEVMADALVAAVRHAGLVTRVTVQSFDWRSLAHVARIAPEIARVHLTSEGTFDTVRRGADGPSPWTAGLDVDDHGGSVPRLVKAAGGRTWSPNARTLTVEALREAQSLGLRVIPWTVNEPDEMARWIALGVDGLITDFPDRLRAVLVRRGARVPAPSPVQVIDVR